MFRYYFGYFKWWIGVLDFYSEGNFSWIDGKFFKYQCWVQGEFLGYYRGNKEDCVVMIVDLYWGCWKDEYCLYYFFFICKIRGK